MNGKIKGGAKVTSMGRKRGKINVRESGKEKMKKEREIKKEEGSKKEEWKRDKKEYGEG